MKKLYLKSELVFALVWIGLYVLIMNLALQFCDGFDALADKTVPQLLIPVGCILALSAAVTLCAAQIGIKNEIGLTPFRAKRADFLWFLPLAAMSCINLKNGTALTAPLAVCVLMAVNMAAAGYVEEIIFRGFLFRAMAKDDLRSAVIVSAVSFGAGHIVNLANTADILSVLLQVCYAIAVGFLYTVIAYKGGSIFPCIASHMFVNGSSVFAAEQGPFTDLVASVWGGATPALTQTCSAALIILLSGSYALWIWRKAPDPDDPA